MEKIKLDFKDSKYATGRRKTSIAKVWLKKGSGKIYVNGKLKKRHEFTSTPKQNFGDLWLNLFGGFEGYLCKMQYFRKALSYQEVESITRQGPSKESCIDGGDKPPYLDDTWWYD